MRVTVRLFARLRDLTGMGELVREVPDDSTAREIWNDLVLEWPGLREYEKTISVAVNAEYSRMTATIRNDDEVAFLPPVSGGASLVRLARRTEAVRPTGSYVR